MIGSVGNPGIGGSQNSFGATHELRHANTTLPESNSSHLKWMIGVDNFPFGNRNSQLSRLSEKILAQLGPIRPETTVAVRLCECGILLDDSFPVKRGNFFGLFFQGSYPANSWRVGWWFFPHRTSVDHWVLDQWQQHGNRAAAVKPEAKCHQKQRQRGRRDHGYHSPWLHRSNVAHHVATVNKDRTEAWQGIWPMVRSGWICLIFITNFKEGFCTWGFLRWDDGNREVIVSWRHWLGSR